ncbi:type II secretion system protein [Synechococcales cyanobacterium C]|uniref:Type II secretion system protein n=2 Tax=Petrachloros TaxID=2918834 RepID=A0A8K1ZZW3_9CYAN|nr:type II secretion system protein [Petrachloros mirabilis ULC683]
MPPLPTTHNPKGFTQIETAIIVVIIGILAAISIPSFLNWLNLKRVDDALARAEGAFKETQREAIKRSQTCSLNIPDGTNPVIRGTCLVTGARTFEGIEFRYSPTTPSWVVIYDFKGRNPVNSAGTLVLSLPNDGTSYQRCLVISSGIGLMRSGHYSGAPGTTIAGSCQSR